MLCWRSVLISAVASGLARDLRYNQCVQALHPALTERTTNDAYHSTPLQLFLIEGSSTNIEIGGFNENLMRALRAVRRRQDRK